MPRFLILSPDREGVLDERLRYRQEHIEYWAGKPGVVLVAGAMLGDGTPTGSMFLLEADSEAAARALLADDPFTTRGVFAGDAQLTEVRPAIGDWLPAA